MLLIIPKHYRVELAIKVNITINLIMVELREIVAEGMHLAVLIEVNLPFVSNTAKPGR